LNWGSQPRWRPWVRSRPAALNHDPAGDGRPSNRRLHLRNRVPGRARRPTSTHLRCPRWSRLITAGPCRCPSRHPTTTGTRRHRLPSTSTA